AAYASHGDTKHVLLIPHTVAECYEFAMQAFDLAEELQTPVLVMSDLDLGMNPSLVDGLAWRDPRTIQRGKVLYAKDLAARENPFYRYLDEDSDGICYRT